MVLTYNCKEALSFLTSNHKEVHASCRIQAQATRKKLHDVVELQMRKEVLIIHTWYTSIADENGNRYDMDIVKQVKHKTIN